jgi:hypothetical protein
MADLDFPLQLRGELRASKRVSQVPSFRASDPSAGPFYVEPLTDDTPVTYDVEFKYTAGEAISFEAWVNSPMYCDKGRNPFNMPIELPGGVFVQEAQFLPDGVPSRPVSQQGRIFTYRATMIVRKLNNPWEDELAEWAVELIPFGDWINATNQVINATWPSVSDL